MRAARTLDRLLVRTPPRPVELGVMTVLLGLLAYVTYAARVRHAGFVTDDWSLRETWLSVTQGRGFVDGLWAFVSQAGFRARPGLAVYLGALQEVLGFHQGLHLAAAVAMAVALSLCLFVLLRMLGLAPLHAGIVALLALVFPGSDAIRLWAIMGDGSWTLCLLTLGAALTLASFRASGRRRAWLRGVGLALYVLSVATYEIGIVAVACSLVLYRCRTTWRPALVAWGQDLAAMTVVYATVTRNSPAPRLTPAETLDHAWDIARGAATLFGTVVVPFLDAEAPALLASGLLVVVALLALRRERDDRVRAELRGWLTAIAVAAVFVAAGYVIFAPGVRLYVPMAPGLGNRINALPGLGLIVIAYALGGLLATLTLRRVPHRGSWSAVATAAFGLLLGGFYLDATRADVRRWDDAYARSQHVLNLMVARMPQPPAGSLVISFGQPTWEAPGIPVWAAQWDLAGAVAIRYGDLTLSALPGFPGASIACRAASAGPVDPTFAAYAPTDIRPYGKLYLFDAYDGRWAAPRNQRECRAVAPRFAPGPWLVAPSP